MSCLECRLEFLEDQSATSEEAIRNLANCVTSGPMTEETVRAKAKIIEGLKRFAEKWAKRMCGHIALKSTETTIFCDPQLAKAVKLMEGIPEDDGKPQKRKPGRPPKQRAE